MLPSVWGDSHLLTTRFPLGHVFQEARGTCQAGLGPSSALRNQLYAYTVGTVVFSLNGHVNDAGGRFLGRDSGSPLVPGVEYLWVVSQVPRPPPQPPPPRRALQTDRAERAQAGCAPFCTAHIHPFRAGQASRPSSRAVWHGGSSARPQQLGSPTSSWLPPPSPPTLGHGRLAGRRPSCHPPLSGGPLFPRLQMLVVLSPEQGLRVPCN